MRQIILDTETTGLATTDGHRIIEIGCVEIVNRQFTGKHFHQYIHPQREIDQAALAVHNITAEFLKDKPKFVEIIESFIAFIEGAELIIHNAAFDIGFLDYEFKLAGANYKQVQHYCSIFDTLALARKKHPGQQNSLDALCKRYSIDNSKRNFHGALLDANLLAEVYLAMTGGQESLFAESFDPVSSNKQNGLILPVLPVSAKNLKILAANAEELSVHQLFLESIKKANNGQCLWQEQEIQTE